MSSSIVPEALVAALKFFVGTDGGLYALEAQSGVAYLLSAGPSTVAAGIPEAPLDGQFYGRQNGAWSAVWAPWVDCTYPPGCSGDLQVRKVGGSNIAMIQLIGSASSVSTWDGTYSFILAHLPPALAPSADQFALVPSSHTAGTPDSVSCAWFKPTGEIAIAYIYEKGPNPLIAWFDGLSIKE